MQIYLEMENLYEITDKLVINIILAVYKSNVNKDLYNL